MMDTIKSNQNKHPTTWTNLSIRLPRKPLSIKELIQCSLIVVSSMWLMGAQADATAPCNVGSGISSTECGVNALATEDNSTALGAFTDATADSSTAVGVSADATARDSTAVGVLAIATATNSTAVGRGAKATAQNSTAVGNLAEASATRSTALGASADATALNSTAVGNFAYARSEGAVSLGYAAGFDDVPVTDSPQAIAIGNRSNIAAMSPGAIAIGGNVDGDFKGAEVTATAAIALGADAQATAAGAIAIGANVVADIENTLVTNVPILAKDPSTTVTPRTMFEIAGAGNTKFNVNNTDANESWAFANPGTGFRLSRQGSGVVEFEVKNNGNAVLAGTLTENSDVNAKQDIQTLDQQAILDKVMGLDINQWRYKDDPGSKHIGPMAQDFYSAFELGHTDKGISTLDSSGVALASIQALKQENLEKATEIATLENTVTSQGTEITELKLQIESMQLQLMEVQELKEQLALVLAMTDSAQLSQVMFE